MARLERYHRRDAIYLHFLDRELTEAAGRAPDELDLVRAVRMLTFLTQSELYCGLSAIWENHRLGSRAHEDFEVLFRHNELQTVTRDLTLAEFRSSRMKAYEHDQRRYPNYYTPAGERLGWLVPTWPKESGSTTPLIRHLRDWLEEPRKPAGYTGRFQPTLHAVQRPVNEGLYRREAEAITYSYFKPFLGSLADKPHAEFAVRRQISLGFTIDNQRHGGGDIATGIPELVFFDQLARDFPRHDIRLLGELAATANLGPIFDCVRMDAESWSRYAATRSAREVRGLSATISWLLDALYASDAALIPGPDDDPRQFHAQHQIRRRLIERIRRSARSASRPRPPNPAERPEEVALRAQDRIVWLAERLAAEDPQLASELEERRSRIDITQADVVLVTVNDIETDQLTRTFEDAGHLARTEWGPINTYRRFGAISGAEIVHVRCTMGSGGQGGSTLTVSDAIRDLRPTSVIGVGVAFGVDEDWQPIGQVLLSQKVTAYELLRMGTDARGSLTVSPLGPSVESSPRLLGRFRDSHLDELGIDMLAGELLSGEKLLDNAQFKEALLGTFPEAVGGEMEGAGVQAASGRAGVDWLIVKAVCDYAVRKAFRKEERQRLAARNAARAVLAVIERGGLHVRRG